MKGLRLAVMLKTNSGGLWIIPQVEEFRRRGHEVVVVLPPGPGRLRSALTERGFQIVDSPFDFKFRPSIATLRGLWRLRRLISMLRPDVLQYHLYASALAARLSTVRFPLRRVHMVVGPLFLESPVIRRVESLLWRWDDVTICGTEFTSRLYGALGCPPERRPAVTCGVDTDRFDPTRSEDCEELSCGHGSEVVKFQERRAKARAEIGVDADLFLAIMVAYVYAPKRMAHQGCGIKGHDILLEAWRAFHARHPRSHLLLAGGGWAEAGEKHRHELIRRFGIDSDPSVTWMESVVDVRRYYDAADLSVSPSLSEGHGAAVEASAMAVPSIVSDAGGLPEVVDDASGWVVPRGDALALTSAFEAAYREFEVGTLAARGERARQRAVRHFDSRTAAVSVADIIERVAGEVRQR